MHRMPVACGADVKPGHGLTRVLPFDSPSGWRDQMAFCIGRREFITLLGSAARVAAGGARAAGRVRATGRGAAGLVADESEAAISRVTVRYYG